MLLDWLSAIFTLVPLMINIAFFTLMERKTLGKIQLRHGPSKVIFWGMFQPFADAMKLLSNSMVLPSKINWVMFLLAPLLSLTLVLCLSTIIPLGFYSLNWEFSLFTLIVFLAMNLYPLLLAGWASNSKYSFMGAIRGVAQTISYEICLSVVILSLMILVSGMNLFWLMKKSVFFLTFFLATPSVILWIIVSVAETNRTPFDFSESESELVSGFNTEYSSVGFTILFLAEYGMMTILATLTSYFTNISEGKWQVFMKAIFFMFFWVWLRASYPRLRYDKLMMMSWKSLLPLAMGGFSINMGYVLWYNPKLNKLEPFKG